MPDTEDTVVFRRPQTGTRQATRQQKAQVCSGHGPQGHGFQEEESASRGHICRLRGRKEVTIAKDRGRWQDLQAGHGPA